jgi:hypothetical protein
MEAAAEADGVTLNSGVEYWSVTDVARVLQLVGALQEASG